MEVEQNLDQTSNIDPISKTTVQNSTAPRTFKPMSKLDLFLATLLSLFWSLVPYSFVSKFPILDSINSFIACAILRCENDRCGGEILGFLVFTPNIIVYLLITLVIAFGLYKLFIRIDSKAIKILLLILAGPVAFVAINVVLHSLGFGVGDLQIPRLNRFCSEIEF